MFLIESSREDILLSEDPADLLSALKNVSETALSTEHVI